jgi:hypothetical protein
LLSPSQSRSLLSPTAVSRFVRAKSEDRSNIHLPGEDFVFSFQNLILSNRIPHLHWSKQSQCVRGSIHASRTHRFQRRQPMHNKTLSGISWRRWYYARVRCIHMMLQDPKSDGSNQLSGRTDVELPSGRESTKGTPVRMNHNRWLRLTMIVFPLAYTILSLLLLSLVGDPRTVFGFAG